MDQGAVPSDATNDSNQQPSASDVPKAFSSAFAVDAASLPACMKVFVARAGGAARPRGGGVVARRLRYARRAARRRRGVVGRRGAASARCLRLVM